MKRTFVFMLLCMSLTGITVKAETVSGYKSLNNSDKSIDYKIKDEKNELIKKNIDFRSAFVEDFQDKKSVDFSDIQKEIAYLLENNILTRNVELNIKDGNISLSQLNLKDAQSNINKSDFLMALYKAKYGIIDSRPVVFNIPSSRLIDGKLSSVLQTSLYKPKGYKGTDTQFDFSEGDYISYVSPNVYELYLSGLVNKGIIPTSEFKSVDFINTLKENGNTVNGMKRYPKWRNDIAPAYYPVANESSINDISFIANTEALGSTQLISSQDNNISLKYKEPDLCFDERIYTLDALKYIEKVLRITEKDITDTEAKIISFKYGVSYLNGLPDGDRKTVIFLVAKGILNFENREEFGNLYSYLNQDTFVKLIYRLYNVNARTDFSKIQLTDSDNFWLERGFNVGDMNIYTTSVLPVSETRSVSSATIQVGLEKKKETILDKLLAIFKLDIKERGVIYAAPGDTKKKYRIAKSFDRPELFTFRNKSVDNLAVGDFDSTVVKVSAPSENDGKLVIDFELEAPSINSAIVMLDSNIQVKPNGIILAGTVGIATRIVGDRVMVLLSGSALEKTLSEIQILNDKVLKNKNTGAMAILLPDKDIALVGNEVIKSEDLMALTTNKEVYYNLDIIKGLLSNAYLNSVTNGNMYVTNKLQNERYVPVLSSTGSEIQKVLVNRFLNVPSESDGKEDRDFFNLTNLTNGITTLIKDYSIMENKRIKHAKLIVDWRYTLPESDSEFNGILNNADPTIKQMSDFLYTRPQDPQLGKWWDSNIGMSDALCNLIYGTENVKYIKSGYLAPSVTILAQDADMETYVKGKIAGDIKFDSNYSYNFLENLPTEFLTKFFGKRSGTSLYDRMAGAREFHSYVGLSISDGVYVFGTEYAVVPSGAVYKYVVSDNRVDYNNGRLFVKTRTKDLLVNNEGRVVRFQGKEYYHDGLTGGIGVARYMRLISLEPVMGTISRTASGMTLRKGMEDAITASLKNATKGMEEESYYIPTDLQSISKLPPRTYLNTGSYVAEGKLYTVDERNTVTLITQNSGDFLGTGLGYSHPVLFLDRTKWVVQSDEIVKRQTYPYLQSGNIFYSGINNSMIDSMLAKSVDTKPINRLNVGDKVLIGDIMFLKTSSGLLSYPVTSSTLVSNLKQNIEKADEAVRKLFIGMTIDYSGKVVPFLNYITSAGVGDIPDDATIDKTLYRNGGLKVKNGATKEVYKSGMSFNTVCVTIGVSDNMLAREMDSTNHVYKLVATSDMYSEGYLQDVPFFTESLGLSARDDMYLGINKIKFNPLANADSLRKKFLESFQSALQGDLKGLLKMLCFIAMSYVILVSWICYPILNYDLGKNIFMAIRDPLRTSDRRGVDIVKVISLGIYNLDMRISSSKLFLSNLSMFTLIVIVINYL